MTAVQLYIFTITIFYISIAWLRIANYLLNSWLIDSLIDWFIDWLAVNQTIALQRSAVPSQMARRTPVEAFMTLLRVGVTNIFRERGSLAIALISLDWDISRSAATVISTVPSTRRSRAAAATCRMQPFSHNDKIVCDLIILIATTLYALWRISNAQLYQRRYCYI